MNYVLNIPDPQRPQRKGNPRTVWKNSRVKVQLARDVEGNRIDRALARLDGDLPTYRMANRLRR
jgi:hypothetical protein